MTWSPNTVYKLIQAIVQNYVLNLSQKATTFRFTTYAQYLTYAWYKTYT